MDVRDDGARKNSSVIVHLERNEWLQVQTVLKAVVMRPAAAIEVVLQRHADERSGGIVELLRQFRHVGGGRLFSGGRCRLSEGTRHDH